MDNGSIKRSLDEDSRSGRVESKQDARKHIGFYYKKELESRLPFLSSRVISGHMTRFLDCKYQRPDPCKNIHNQIQNSFGSSHQTLGVGVRVDLNKTFDKSSCIG